MYKLILVDDEEEVRKGILQKIEWEKIGFEIVGEAENGREALEIAERVEPDVVITDIKMPFMDGLTLSQNLHEKFPAVKIIILTGFDEFEYAQKAIKLNVIEYALKPISAQELVDILVKVKGYIDEEIAQKEDMHYLMEYYKKSLPILKEKFLTSLITSKLQSAEIYEKSRDYDIDLDGNGFVVSVLSADYNCVDSGIYFKEGIKPSEIKSLSTSDEKGILKLAILDLCNEVIGKYNLGMAFLHNEHTVLITVCNESERDVVIKKTLSALEEVRQSTRRFLKLTVTVGVGTVCSDSTLIYQSYQNALSALDYRLIMGNDRIIWIEDVEPYCMNRIVFDESKEHALISCIKVGTEEEIDKTIESFFEEITEAKTSFKDYQIYLLEILTTILKVARDSNVNMTNILGTNYNLFVELYKFNHIQEVKGWIKEICAKVMNYILKDRQNASKLLAEKAKEYVALNYHESDVTIDRVCKYLHISPAYFSSIFKRETKMTFINYLTQVRMDAAKELLRTTNMKSFEIAEKVGYSEPNYFSYCFKRNFSISPSEYRKLSKSV